MSTKTAIVTGAAGNLGSAVVTKFIGNNFKVIAAVRNKGMTTTARANCEEVALDLTDEESCQEFIDKMIIENNSIDVAVLTAGGFTMGNVASTKTSDIAKQYKLNFETAYNIARPVFAQMMKQNSGRIFLIGSRQGLDFSHAKGVTAYAFSKSLIFRLAEIMNAEAKGKNVVISVIAPSTIDTPENRISMPDADFSAWVSPAQVADVIYYYSGTEADVLREPVIKVYNKA
ncbi:MAG TPA: SDR family NAD(P)-dependent oxidoreductase [Hanamia sp.]|nr:SDR family NAD(P)-dependent oxidoreductase [Hanamia sp.]